jgi:5-methyltetrahydrofolate--homocysteine methyltransferase
VIDIGIDAPPDKFVAAVRQHRARLVGMSALTGMTMPAMKTTVEAFDAAGLRGQVKIMVGGAIVTQTYADSIGADGYAPDAALAVDKAKQLLGG